MEEARRHIFGSRDPRKPLPPALRYTLPPGVKLIPCREDENGEYVPIEPPEEVDERSECSD